MSKSELEAKVAEMREYQASLLARIDALEKALQEARKEKKTPTKRTKWNDHSLTSVLRTLFHLCPNDEFTVTMAYGKLCQSIGAPFANNTIRGASFAALSENKPGADVTLEEENELRALLGMEPRKLVDPIIVVEESPVTEVVSQVA
jgi:hypothetical protein